KISGTINYAQQHIKTMLKSVSFESLCSLATPDCPADNHARQLAQFLYETLHAIAYRQGEFFLKVLGGCYLDPGMGRIRTYLLVASPSIVAMRSWRVFWDFPNVITLHILAVKVVDLTDTVYGSNPLIFSHSRIRF